MATAIHPRPDMPQRPPMTAEVLRGLYASDIIEGNPTAAARSAKQWLTEMRKWAAWAIEYCKRLDDTYIEHQAVAHDLHVEPGALADAGLCMMADACKVCAYLYE